FVSFCAFSSGNRTESLYAYCASSPCDFLGSFYRWQETSTTMKVNRAANPEANKHTSGPVSFATHQSRLEKELKQPPTFQEVFNKMHKKRRTDQYISDRAQEIAESYSQHMADKYVGEEEQP
ncbi:hypothetical protein Taro_036336, partial [Colocasia esculenta]|nr:hypothetical protein [Colocasia esculenta]